MWGLIRAKEAAHETVPLQARHNKHWEKRLHHPVKLPNIDSTSHGSYMFPVEYVEKQFSLINNI